MKDRLIIGILIGITIGVLLLAYPIVESGGGTILKLEGYEREMQAIEDRVLGLEERMKKEESNKWFGK